MTLDVNSTHSHKSSHPFDYYLRLDGTCVEDDKIADRIGLSYDEYVEILRKFGAKRDNENGYFYFYTYNKAERCMNYILENFLN